jgi:hypothetical protein
MAIVNALKFDDHSGAMLTDEESWLLRRRRTFFGDNLHSLLSPEMADALNIEAVYGCTGLPSFHFEVVQKTRRRLESAYAKGGRSQGGIDGLRTLDDVAKVTMDVMRDLTRRRVDERLKFLYGFTADDLNRGFFETGGQKYDIKQDCVRDRAMKLVTWSDKGALMKNVFENHAVVIGHDPRHGYNAFVLKGELSVLSFVSAGFEALGSGKYAAGIAFAKYLNSRSLAQRKRGLNRTEAMIELINTGTAAADYFGECGGYFNICYVDGRGATHAQRFVNIRDHAAKLAAEIVAAYKEGFLKKADAFGLIDELVFARGKWESVEQAMFKKAKNAKGMDFILRGYKSLPA